MTATRPRRTCATRSAWSNGWRLAHWSAARRMAGHAKHPRVDSKPAAGHGIEIDGEPHFRSPGLQAEHAAVGAELLPFADHQHRPAHHALQEAARAAESRGRRHRWRRTRSNASAARPAACTARSAASTRGRPRPAVHRRRALPDRAQPDRPRLRRPSRVAHDARDDGRDRGPVASGAAAGALVAAASSAAAAPASAHSNAAAITARPLRPRPLPAGQAGRAVIANRRMRSHCGVQARRTTRCGASWRATQGQSARKYCHDGLVNQRRLRSHREQPCRSSRPHVADAMFGTRRENRCDAQAPCSAAAPPLACRRDADARRRAGGLRRCAPGGGARCSRLRPPHPRRHPKCRRRRPSVRRRRKPLPTKPRSSRVSRAGSTTFAPACSAAGIDEATLRVAFDDVQYLPRVVELDRAQPEFTRTVWDYLDTRGDAATRRARPGQAAAGAQRGRRRGRALRRAAGDRGGHLGHREQLRRQLRQHADHRRAGDAGLRRPARGLGARPVAGGAEDPAKRRHRPRAT